MLKYTKNPQVDLFNLRTFRLSLVLMLLAGFYS